MNQHYISQTPSTPHPSPVEQKVYDALSKIFPPWLIATAGITIAFLVICNILSRKKNVLAHARFAKRSEIRAMQKEVRKQQAHSSASKFALRFGTDHTYGIPEAGPAIAVVGQSGCGKTATYIDPAITYAIDNEATIFVYDAKGVQLKRHFAYALAKGYFAKVYSPGRLYSKEVQATINFLDFLRDGKEDMMAAQLSHVFNENFAVSRASRDPYFGQNGDALLQAVLMAAKQFPDPDLLTAWKILSLPNLADRLHTAYVARSFSDDVKDILFTDLMYDNTFRWAIENAMGTIAVADADQTSGGIVSSAVTQFKKIIGPSFIPHFLETNIPLDLHGKEIIFFEPDKEASASTSPLCAAAIHMLVERNLLSDKPRDRPLIVFLDEFTSANFPALERWAALLREQGIILVLGYQSDAQTHHRYGNDLADSIVSNCPTKIYLKPGHRKTAEGISRSLGEKEVRYTEFSGGKAQKHRAKAPLMTAEDIDTMGKGEAIIFNPLLKHPWHHKARYHPKDLIVRRYQECERVWDQKLASSANSELKTLEEIDAEKDTREIIAAGFFPSSKDIKNVQEMLRLQKEGQQKKEQEAKQQEVGNNDTGSSILILGGLS
jgi:type IV secretion system protein VirD4